MCYITSLLPNTIAHDPYAYQHDITILHPIAVRLPPCCLHWPAAVRSALQHRITSAACFSPTVFPLQRVMRTGLTCVVLVAQTYAEPTVIIAQRVTGEEEVPEGAVAVLTPDAPDVLSHVSVRARNMRVLFAICHDSEELAKVRGSIVHIATASCTWVAAATRPSGRFATSAIVQHFWWDLTASVWCTRCQS